MSTGFVWFIWALTVTISNIILSIVIYYSLETQKKLNKKLLGLKEVCMLYALGMMFLLIASIVLFLVFS